MNAPENVMRRIVKLLAMSKDTSSPNEAAVAAGMAERLMRKYQIEHSDVLLSDMEQGGVSRSTFDNRTKTIPPWVNILAVGVARLHEVAIQIRGGTVVFIGMTLDIKVSISTLDYLIKATNRLAREFSGDRGDKGSFRRGCATTLQQRMYQLSVERQQEFSETEAGTALVVAKKQMIEEALGYSMRGRLEQYSRRERVGYLAGKMAGQRINLSEQLQEG